MHVKNGWPVHMLNEVCGQMQRAEVHYQEEKSCIQQQITELHDLLRTLGSNIKVPIEQLKHWSP